MFEFRSEVILSCLVWITSLDEQDQGVTQRVLEDTESLLSKKGVPWTLVTPVTETEFWKALDWVEEAAASGARPIIHFDMHGSSDRGMQIAQSGEYINWRSISQKLKRIGAGLDNAKRRYLSYGYNPSPQSSRP